MCYEGFTQSRDNRFKWKREGPSTRAKIRRRRCWGMFQQIEEWISKWRSCYHWWEALEQRMLRDGTEGKDSPYKVCDRDDNLRFIQTESYNEVIIDELSFFFVRLTIFAYLCPYETIWKWSFSCWSCLSFFMLLHHLWASLVSRWVKNICWVSWIGNCLEEGHGLAQCGRSPWTERWHDREVLKLKRNGSSNNNSFY